MIERRDSAAEMRVEGRTLTGPALVYGDVSPSHRERFERGAFDLTGGATRWLDYRHDRERALAWTNGGGLTLTDTRDALMVRAELPEIPLADRALADVRSGRLSGFSVEFRALAERREGGLRVIERAELSGVGVVGAPSYHQSTVEIRGRSGRSFRATIPSRRKVECRCSGAGCKFARFQADAMQDMWDDAWGEFERWAAAGEKGPRPRDVVAGFGNYSDMPLASISRGTLRGRMVGGSLVVEVDVPEGATGAAAISAHESAGVIVRPHLDADESVGVQDGDTVTYSKARLRGILLSATDAREGWPDPELIATPDTEMASAGAARKPRQTGQFGTVQRRNRAWR